MTADDGTEPGLDDHRVRAVVTAVLDAEGAGEAAVSVTFLSGQAMRAVNRRSFGADVPTDVIAFTLEHPGQLVGDVYVCPSVAQRHADARGEAVEDELVRLVVHGTLHVLGYSHPEGVGREASPMWRRQERYVAAMRQQLP